MAQESVLRIVIDSRNAERNAHALANELESIEKNGNFATKSMDSMSVATRQLAGYMAGIVTVGAAINRMDAYTSINNKLKLVTNSQAELNQAMQDTFAIAQRSASSWSAVNDVYSKYMSNAKTLNLTQEQTARLTEITSKAVAISGSTTESAAGALFQYGQALDGNILRGEEYNALVDGAGGLLSAMAKGLNVTRGELRQMMLDGKLTGEVITKALLKAGDSVDELHAKTDVTIGSSLVVLGDSVTKFVGEASAGSGAATVLAGSIKTLAENLDLIADIAVVGGVALLTKTILTQAVAIHGSTVATMEKRAADIAALQSQLQLAAIEVQRTRQVAALAISELGLARQELNSATTRQARAAATMRLTQAEIALAIAEKQKTAATAVDTAIQNANNAARSRGAALLGLAGGWTGVLTIGVAGLAAGYMYLKSRTAEANAKLEEQGKVASIATEELLKLEGAKRGQAKTDLAESFEAENTKLKLLNTEIGNYIAELASKNTADAKTAQILKDVRMGTMTYDEALEKLNKSHADQPDIITKMEAAIVKYKESAVVAQNNADKQKAMGSEVRVAGNEAQNSVIKHKAQAEAIDEVATAAQKAVKAQEALTKSLADRKYDAEFTQKALALGMSEEKIKATLEAANFARKQGVKVTDDMFKASLAVSSIEQKNKDVIDAKHEAEKKVTKEKESQAKLAEKQAKLGQRLIGISGNSGIGTGAHLDVRYGGSRDGQKVSKEHLERLQAGGKELTKYRVSSGYGQRKAPTAGASSFHKGIDFAMPVGTPITTNVAVKDVQTSFDAKGGGYYSTVTFEDGVVLKLLHQSPGMQGKVKSGASKGSSTAKSDNYDTYEDQLNLQKSLELDAANEITKIRENLKDKLEEIDKAGFSPERTKELKAEYQARADNDIAIANYALKTKLNDYSAFKKTESQLLEDSFNEKKFYAARDLELSKENRVKAVQLLDDQLKQELALVELAKEQRMFQMREQFMTETAAMEERYRIEHMRLIETNDLEERNFKQQMLRLQKQEEVRNRLNNAVQNWGRIEAEMNGTGDQWQLEQTRFGRYDQSQELFDSKMSDINQQAQDPNANIQEIADQRVAIWQEYHDRMTNIESAYQQDSLNLQLTQAQNMTGALAGMFGAMLGESSSAYRALYMAQQSFALAQAGMNVWKSASDAYANEPGTVWQKAGAAALATIKSGTFVSLIQAATPKGFETGGYTGSSGRKDVAGVVHGQEYVLNAAATKRVGVGTLDAINSGKSLGGGDVVNAPITVNVSIQANGESSVDSQGQSKQLGQMIGNAVRAVIRQEQRQGGLLSK